MKRLQKYLVAPLVAASAALAACTVPPPATSEKTIAQQLLSDTGDNAAGFDDEWYDFDIATQALLLFPDLVEAASNPDADLTVFLPNDRAFQVLVADLTGNWIWDEEGVFNAVASLGVDTVKTVLTYHIVPSRISAADALAADGAKLTTLQGGEVTVRVENPLLSLIRLEDLDPNAGDGGIVFSKFNYGGELANGFIHGVSLVLRPVDL